MSYPNYDLTINRVVEIAHRTAEHKGFWDNPDFNIPEKLMLIVSEVAEAMEELRKLNFDSESIEVLLFDEHDKPIGFVSELADVVIRIGDLCGKLGIDLEAAIKAKLEYNFTRERMHGKRF